MLKKLEKEWIKNFDKTLLKVKKEMLNYLLGRGYNIKMYPDLEIIVNNYEDWQCHNRIWRQWS